MLKNLDAWDLNAEPAGDLTWEPEDAGAFAIHYRHAEAPDSECDSSAGSSGPDQALVSSLDEIYGQKEENEIPSASFIQHHWIVLFPLLILTAGSIALHRHMIGYHISPEAIAAWVTVTVINVAQCLLSWGQRVYRGPATGSVAVIIPCYNEDPALLARVLYSLRRQTIWPNEILVTDDGSNVDYSEIRDRYPEVTWLRTGNRGKKHAQAYAIRRAMWADFYVTIDSDSALEERALEENLRPFADPRVLASAGVETAHNWNKNILTRAISARSLAFQLFAMSSQARAGGNVLICPGAFSTYRGSLIREVLDEYVNETWCGQPCILGDDTALTFHALMRGRVVQQPTAFCFPVYPERVSHHLRQWVRWMRASTIRQVWRIRYLPVTSYAWWFSVWQLAAFIAGVAASLLVVITWPASVQLVIGAGIGLLGWPVMLGFRLFCIRRSDQTRLQMLKGVALMPLAALWYLLVLRQIRFYGIATCAKQNWNTRENVEVSL